MVDNDGIDINDRKMGQCSKPNSGTRMKSSGDTKMQRTCFEHEICDVTARPR